MNFKNTILLNGGTTEFGEALAKKLVKEGNYLILVSDDSVESFEIQKEIYDLYGYKIDLFLTDYASQREIKELAESIENKYPKLNIIINNYSTTSVEKVITEDNIELIFQANYISRFLLTNLLIPILANNKHSKIINVIDKIDNKLELDFDFIENNTNIETSKEAEEQAILADIMYIQTLSEKLINTSITANSIYPGKIEKEIYTDDFSERSMKLLGKKIVNSFTTGPKKASYYVYNIIHNLGGKSGKLYKKNRPTTIPIFAAKQKNRDKLWELSNLLTESTFDIF